MVASIRQHFRRDEETFIRQAEAWIRQAGDEYRPVLTDFLNPRQRYIVQTLVNRVQDLRMYEAGVFRQAENQRLLLAPAYYTPETADFDLALLAVRYPVKFAQLSHRAILGSLMHAGLKREAIGDIVTDGQGEWQLATTRPLAEFISQQINRIGGTKVSFTLLPPSGALQPTLMWQEEELLVTALRVDNVVAKVWHLSRNEAKVLVETGQVRINWTDCQRPDYTLGVRDLISVRHFGRFKIVADNGLTKKEKIRLTVAVLKK